MPLVTRQANSGRLFVGTTEPQTPLTGDLFSNTSDDTLSQFDGTDFNNVGRNIAELIAYG